MIASKADHQGADKNSISRLPISDLKLYRSSRMWALDAASLDAPVQMIEGLAQRQSLASDEPEAMAS
jgi:hypothetical protein